MPTTVVSRGQKEEKKKKKKKIPSMSNGGKSLPLQVDWIPDEVMNPWALDPAFTNRLGEYILHNFKNI